MNNNSDRPSEDEDPQGHGKEPLTVKRAVECRCSMAWPPPRDPGRRVEFSFFYCVFYVRMGAS